VELQVPPVKCGSAPRVMGLSRRNLGLGVVGAGPARVPRDDVCGQLDPRVEHPGRGLRRLLTACCLMSLALL